MGICQAQIMFEENRKQEQLRNLLSRPILINNE